MLSTPNDRANLRLAWWAEWTAKTGINEKSRFFAVSAQISSRFSRYLAANCSGTREKAPILTLPSISLNSPLVI
jgi:hypothetical protein